MVDGEKVCAGHFKYFNIFLFTISSFTPTTNNNKGDLSLDELNRQLLSSQNKKQVLAIQGPESPKNPSKRMRVSDIHLSRYHEEFVVISKVAEGSFGTVYVAKHRLDGMLYALKVKYSALNFESINVCRKFFF